MADIEKVIKALEECVKYDYSCKKCPYKPKSNDEEKDCSIELTKDALALLKEQKALLNKACETIADMDFEHFCDDLMCDDGWCEENCKTSGTQPKCIERWLRKQVERTEKHDCRDCKKWLECPNGMRGHIKGTSIGFSIGECVDFIPKRTNT